MNAHRILAIAAASLAVLAAATSPSRSTRGDVDVAKLSGMIAREEDHVTALELAAWLRDHKPGLRVLDVRTDSEYTAYHIPFAEHLALEKIASLTPKDSETLVLYSEGGAHAAQAWVLLRASGHRDVYFLKGGLLEWLDDVVNPVRTAGAHDARSDSAWASQSALSRYFGGVPRIANASAISSDAMPGASNGGSTSEAPRGNTESARTDASNNAAATVARVRRRGC